MPGDGRTSADSSELMDNLARKEVNTVLVERKLGVTDTFTPQLVEFGLFHPLNTLKNNYYQLNNKKRFSLNYLQTKVYLPETLEVRRDLVEGFQQFCQSHWHGNRPHLLLLDILLL